MQTFAGCRDWPALCRALATGSHFRVKQEMEIAEIVTGCEFQNKYIVLDENNVAVMRIKEKTKCCSRQCERTCDATFEFQSLDGQNVFFTMRRNYSCFFCCLRFSNVFKVYQGSESDDEIIRLESAKCVCTNKVKFKYKDYGISGDFKSGFACCECQYWKKTYKAEFDGFEVEIKKTLRGGKDIFMELISDADNFVICFKGSPDQATKEKLIVLLMACCLNIDLNYFESSGEQNRGLYAYMN